MNDAYVQYGCGLSAPKSWRNFDASPTLQMQRLPLLGSLFRSSLFSNKGFLIFPLNVEHADIVSGLPLKKESCDAIYCSHILEHLALNDFRLALRNTYSYLKPGGVFRLVLPDLETLAREYLESEDPQASLKFMDESKLGFKDRPRGALGMLRRLLGNSAHLWMWDFESLSLELKEAGFKEIRRAEFGDSADPQFKAVEDPLRWKDCLGMECRK
ncbi:MAG: methyltransferase domain-containing protein [Candidatus Obscuribacterales bacterium]|nr:methyltransferase domain-containing protein [Candidatus Obscuribacterales bacterium]